MITQPILRLFGHICNYLLENISLKVGMPVALAVAESLEAAKGPEPEGRGYGGYGGGHVVSCCSSSGSWLLALEPSSNIDLWHGCKCMA